MTERIHRPVTSSSSLPAASSHSSAPITSPDGSQLSRRLSWNRGADTEQRPRMSQSDHPLYSESSYTSSQRDTGYDSPFDEDRAHSTYNYAQPSLVSLAHFPEPAPGESDDEQGLTGAARQPWRGDENYEDDAERLAADPARRRRYAGSTPLRTSSVGGNALRVVSRNLRRVSLRVVDFASAGAKDQVKLQDTPDDDAVGPRKLEVDNTPKQTSSRLRGKTLAIFGPDSRVRTAMFEFLIWPWTEPMILVLIFIHAIVLIVQCSRDVQTSPRPLRFFGEWEDLVLFILFTVYSLETFARIIVSGLVLDPEIRWRSVTFGWRDLLPQKRPVVRGRFPDDPTERHPSEPVSPTTRPRHTANASSAWQLSRTELSLPHITKSGSTRLEAPFQLAMEKQRSLSEQGRPYLRHSWNRIDFVSVISFWIMFGLSLPGVEARSHIYVFRAFSVLRISRLLAVTSGTATIMRSLKKAAPLLVRVATFILFAMILFSIIGVQAFKGSFRRTCQLDLPDGTLVQLGQTCGGHIDPVTLNATGFITRQGNDTQAYTKGYVCALGQTCVDTGENPYNNIESFDNILLAALQVVILASVNTWAPVMYSMMDSEFFISCLFFIVGVIILNLWLLNLFVAVITNTFSVIREETKASAFGANAVGPTFDEQGEGWSVVDGKRVQSPSFLLNWYNYTNWAWVLLALVSLAFQATRTANSKDGDLKFLDSVEMYITFAFDVEIIWRIVGHFPNWRLFYRQKRNILDLSLAIGSTIIQIPIIHKSAVYPWLTIFQLTRFYRVILFVPRMRPLLLQVFGNLYGLINMTLFLLLTNLIGGIIAAQLFRGDIDDPDTQMGFYQVFNSFLSMYQVFTSENWTDVMYSAATSGTPFHQSAIGVLFVSVWFLFANFIMLQMFIAVINENFEVAEEQKRAQQIQAYVRNTAPSSARVNWLDRWNPYRFLKSNPKAIAVDALPANLVLPMQKSLVQDHRSHRARHTQGGSSDAFFEASSSQRRGFAGTLERLFELNPRREDIPLSNLKNVRRESMTELRLMQDETERHLDILTAVGGDQVHDETHDALAEEQARKADFIASHPTYDRSLWIFSQKNILRRLLQKMVPPSNGDRIFGAAPTFLGQAAFQLFILLAVVGGIIVAGIATPVYRRQFTIDHPEVQFPWFEISEATFGLVLVVELIIKVIADGFIFTPNAYLYSIWNVVDFVILLVLLGNMIPTLIVFGTLSRFVRSLKAFRALRLITMFGWMRTTFHSVIFAGALRILDAAVLAILYMIPYAVWGLNIFSGLMFSCNDGADGMVKNGCINEYVSYPIAPDPNTPNLGFLAPRAWANPATGTRWSFDNFRSSLLILFETVSLEGWIDVLSAAMGITGTDQQPSLNASQVNAIFFLAYNLLGAVVILTLFVSIIIGNFSTRSGMALLTAEQRQWIDLQKLLKRQRPSRRPKGRPVSSWKAWCFDRAVHKHGWWSRMMTGLYCLHIVNLTVQTFNDEGSLLFWQDALFLATTLIYSIDILVRYVGLGSSFWANGWNLFDLVVVLGSFATTLANIRGVDDFSALQMQKLFLVSIAFKLVQKFNALNQLFKTSVASLPAIMKLFLLWLVLFLFFGIAYVEVFSLTRWYSGETHNQNYRSLGNALIMLAFMSTGEGWNQFMHDYATEYPLCTNASPNDVTSDCGSTAWAFSLFIAWNVLSMYIFVNMFTGVVVENFSYVFQLSGPASLTREEMRAFKKVWAEFDPGRRGYIQRQSFVPFFAKLSGVFEVRIYPVESSVKNILARAQEADLDNRQERKTLYVEGLDLKKFNQVLATIDPSQTRRRRMIYNRLYHEALVIEEPGKGISFNSMLVLLAHYKIIDDEKALKVDEMLRRQITTDYVTDRVNLDRVRSLLKMLYHRRRHVAWKAEQVQLERAKTMGDIPEIYVDGRPSTPPTAKTRDITLANRESMYLESPQRPRFLAHTPQPSSPTGPHRRISDLSMLSADLGSRSENSSRDSSPSRDSRISPDDAQQVLYSLNSSMWGEMMHDAAEED